MDTRTTIRSASGMRDAAHEMLPSARSDLPPLETSVVDQPLRRQRQRPIQQPTVEEESDPDEVAAPVCVETQQESVQNSSLEYVAPAAETQSRGTVVTLPNGGRLLFPPGGAPRGRTLTAGPPMAVPRPTDQHSTFPVFNPSVNPSVGSQLPLPAPTALNSFSPAQVASARTHVQNLLTPSVPCARPAPSPAHRPAAKKARADPTQVSREGPASPRIGSRSRRNLSPDEVDQCAPPLPSFP
ncbi:hypothetical protein C0992_001797 [Termitomyces sp. T32_za158]|nr:hypothetical protein C0992_001797 [Termitomyces sp. T32_za158]